MSQRRPCICSQNYFQIHRWRLQPSFHPNNWCGLQDPHLGGGRCQDQASIVGHRRARAVPGDSSKLLSGGKGHLCGVRRDEYGKFPQLDQLAGGGGQTHRAGCDQGESYLVEIHVINGWNLRNMIWDYIDQIIGLYWSDDQIILIRWSLGTRATFRAGWSGMTRLPALPLR